MDRTASKITNMTEGDPVRIILTFAVPLFIGNIFQQVYSLVDTMIAGHFLGDQLSGACARCFWLFFMLQ